MRDLKEGGFIRSRRLWVIFAIFTELILLVSISSTARGENNLVLQLAGVSALLALMTMSLFQCRCPHCRRFLFDRKSLALGWGLKQCPHCEKALRNL